MSIGKKLGLSQAELAELSGVSQHFLSAFELEKELTLSVDLREAVSHALADSAKVSNVANRRKRYQKHTYGAVQKSADRVARATPTADNVDYCKTLD